MSIGMHMTFIITGTLAIIKYGNEITTAPEGKCNFDGALRGIANRWHLYFFSKR